jgi:chromosome condensin MukBEF ATPase and DNA-binding subunit MukB
MAVGLGLTTGCGTENASDSCNKGDDVEEALRELDELAEDDTTAANVDTRLEELGEQVNDVMNTTDDENALQPRDADLSFDDLRDSIEDMGNAEDVGETGEALADTLDQLAEGVGNMADGVEEECTP